MKIYRDRYSMYRKVASLKTAFMFRQQSYKRSKEFTFRKDTNKVYSNPALNVNISEISTYIKNNGLYTSISKFSECVLFNIESIEHYIPIYSFLTEEDLYLTKSNRIDNISIMRNIKKSVHFIYSKK